MLALPSSGRPWAVEPAQRVGAFALGMGINEALGVVQKMGSLDEAELCFDEQRAFEADLVLRLPTLGIQLCFDPFTQDLRVISCCLQGNNTNLGSSESPETAVSRGAQLPQLSYSNNVFANSRSSPCFREVYDLFGPTWIGDFCADRSTYDLKYPGLTFEFPLPSEMFDTLLRRGEHPIELLDGQSPSAARMWVFPSGSPSYALPALASPDPETALVCPASGVVLCSRSLRFGLTPQDVFSDFGPPEQVCVKDVDAVRIHSASAPPKVPNPDYYYNYFHLGLDLLFDGSSHLMKKVVLHTNPPTHELFSRYARCFFRLRIPVPAAGRRKTSAAAPSAAARSMDRERTSPTAFVLPPVAQSSASAAPVLEFAAQSNVTQPSASIVDPSPAQSSAIQPPEKLHFQSLLDAPLWTEETAGSTPEVSEPTLDRKQVTSGESAKQSQIDEVGDAVPEDGAAEDSAAEDTTQVEEEPVGQRKKKGGKAKGKARSAVAKQADSDNSDDDLLLGRKAKKMLLKEAAAAATDDRAWDTVPGRKAKGGKAKKKAKGGKLDGRNPMGSPQSEPVSLACSPLLGNSSPASQTAHGKQIAQSSPEPEGAVFECMVDEFEGLGAPALAIAENDGAEGLTEDFEPRGGGKRKGAKGKRGQAKKRAQSQSDDEGRAGDVSTACSPALLPDASCTPAISDSPVETEADLLSFTAPSIEERHESQQHHQQKQAQQDVQKNDALVEGSSASALSTGKASQPVMVITPVLPAATEIESQVTSATGGYPASQSNLQLPLAQERPTGCPASQAALQAHLLQERPQSSVEGDGQQAFLHAPDEDGYVNIDVRWPWPEIQEELANQNMHCGKPLVVNNGTLTPFGSTYFYAFPGLIFEVMCNNFVASLTVFSVPGDELPLVFREEQQ